MVYFVTALHTVDTAWQMTDPTKVKCNSNSFKICTQIKAWFACLSIHGWCQR